MSATQWHENTTENREAHLRPISGLVPVWVARQDGADSLSYWLPNMDMFVWGDVNIPHEQVQWFAVLEAPPPPENAGPRNERLGI